MQLVNDAPVANSQPVAVTALKLRDVVVLDIGSSGDFFDLSHNPLLPVQGKPRQRLAENFVVMTEYTNQLSPGVTMPVKPKCDPANIISLKSSAAVALFAGPNGRPRQGRELETAGKC